MLYDRGIVTGRGLSKDDDFENVGRPAAEASADLGSPSDRRAIAATCSKVPTVIRSRPHKPHPVGFDVFYVARLGRQIGRQAGARCSPCTVFCT